MARHSYNDGKQLEELVATIERLLVPKGFTVETNDLVFDDQGAQIAELDIHIRGKVGSAAFSWLIECRSRPSDGAAPGSWIEQLVGRRGRFKFDKVTAVSTTGFAAGAADYAATVGIDLREVHEIAPEVMGWLRMGNMSSFEERYILLEACLRITHAESRERQDAFMAAASGKRKDERFLRSTETNVATSPLDAFVGAVRQNPSLFEDVMPNAPAKHIQVTIQYPDDKSHFVVDTALGPVRIAEIDFEGELSLIETAVPPSRVAEYRTVGKNSPVSQTAGFMFEVGGEKVLLDFHRLIDSGETHVTVRRLGVELPKPRTDAPPKAPTD